MCLIFFPGMEKNGQCEVANGAGLNKLISCAMLKSVYATLQ